MLPERKRPLALAAPGDAVIFPVTSACRADRDRARLILQQTNNEQPSFPHFPSTYKPPFKQSPQNSSDPPHTKPLSHETTMRQTPISKSSKGFKSPTYPESAILFSFSFQKGYFEVASSLSTLFLVHVGVTNVTNSSLKLVTKCHAIFSTMFLSLSTLEAVDCSRSAEW